MHCISPNPRISKPTSKSKVFVRDSSRDLTREQAVEKLIKLTPNGTTMDTTDKGTPMFMFGTAEGKSRAVKILYDSGCSDLLMKHGLART